jgi:hypothetical protein
MATFAQIPSSLSLCTKPVTKSTFFLIHKRGTLLSFHPIKSDSNSSATTVSPSLEEKLEVNAHVEKKVEGQATHTLVSPGSVSTNGAKLEIPKRFNDPRWVNGTWDLDQFIKNGRTDWDAVIDAGKFITSYARNYATGSFFFKKKTVCVNFFGFMNGFGLE